MVWTIESGRTFPLHTWPAQARVILTDHPSTRWQYCAAESETWPLSVLVKSLRTLFVVDLVRRWVSCLMTEEGRAVEPVFRLGRVAFRSRLESEARYGQLRTFHTLHEHLD